MGISKDDERVVCDDRLQLFSYPQRDIGLPLLAPLIFSVRMVKKSVARLPPQKTGYSKGNGSIGNTMMVIERPYNEHLPAQ